MSLSAVANEFEAQNWLKMIEEELNLTMTNLLTYSFSTKKGGQKFLNPSNWIPRGAPACLWSVGQNFKLEQVGDCEWLHFFILQWLLLLSKLVDVIKYCTDKWGIIAMLAILSQFKKFSQIGMPNFSFGWYLVLLRFQSSEHEQCMGSTQSKLAVHPFKHWLGWMVHGWIWYNHST